MVNNTVCIKGKTPFASATEDYIAKHQEGVEWKDGSDLEERIIATIEQAKEWSHWQMGFFLLYTQCYLP